VIRKVALSACSCLLTSCATPSPPRAIPPSLCTSVERTAAMPAGAGIVQPVTEEERNATREFLLWVSDALSIGEANANRAETAKGLCRG